jgi:2-polyprenyl-3-methyl-5-hydroxy-6-metoxy-1,4-benzoquinol methylase
MGIEKDDGYYAGKREDILSLINLRDGAKILDVGCGYGGIGKLINAKYKAEIHGIDISQIAVDKARIYYDSVMAGNIETDEFDYQAAYFDIIICSDILEHLSDPWNALRKLKKYLKDDGLIVASIPNIRNAEVIVQLLDGSFDYQEFGVLDDTHLRFFTYRSSINLFERSGFEVIKIHRKVINSDCNQIIDIWKQAEIPQRASILIKGIMGKDITLGDDFLVDLLTFQFLIMAGKQEHFNV